LLYYFLRPIVTFLLKFLIKHISITGLDNIPKSGAVMLSSNHSNSFFDAVIICCTLERRIWSLARGDVFKKPIAKKLLSSLFMMPVHRLSEGKEHLGDNDDTFKKCIDLFKQGEVILIFSEGICTNQTKLLPLKKGTARLAQKAWSDGIDLVVVPVGITYNNFKLFGKQINLNFGSKMSKADFESVSDDGFFLKAFNDKLTEKLNKILDWSFPKKGFAQGLLFSLGSVINFPANFISAAVSRKMTKGSVFFDSITLGLFIVVLPIYWILLINILLILL
jgi:1-acyl-sn-glycerol-3-phosphate acyltransferase